MAGADPQALLQALAALDDVSLVTVLTETLHKRPELAPGVVNAAVPDLTYAPGDALSKRRATGRVMPHSGTGMGFIDCPELKAVFGSDVYVHKNQVGSYSPGTEVNFAILLSKDMKPQAFDLQPTGPSAMGNGAMGKGLGGKGKGDMGSMGMGMGGMGMGGMGMEMMGMGMGKGMDKGMGKGPKVLSADAKPDVQQILGNYVGQIKSFNAKNGFGFIVCQALQEQGYQQDVYLHHNQVGDHQIGSMVTFTAYLNKKGQPQSMDLSAIA